MAPVVKKSLAGVEDLLFGSGTETQQRANGSYPITRLRYEWPCGSIQELLGLDTTKFVYATLIAGGSTHDLEYKNGAWVNRGETDQLCVYSFDFSTGGIVTAVGQTVLDPTTNAWYKYIGTVPYNIQSPTAVGWVKLAQGSLSFKLRSVMREVLHTGQYGLRDYVSVKDYGAIGDWTLHTLQEWVDSGLYDSLGAIQLKYPVAQSLTDSIDWVAIQQCQNDNPDRIIRIPSGGYIMLKTLYAKYLLGEGPMSAWRAAPFSVFNSSLYTVRLGTNLVYAGTGAKEHTVDYITASKQCGYDRPNPVRNYNNAYDAEFLLSDFTNKDAVAAQRATLKPFSCCVVVGSGQANDWHSYGLANVRVVVSCPGDGETYGIGGYGNQASIIPWSDWDVGVWYKCPWRCWLTDSQIVGYYNIRGMLFTTMAYDAQGDILADSGYSEFFKAQSSVIQGGTAIRSGDVWPVLAKTADTLTVEWTSSHRFAASGSLMTSNGGTITYTGLTYVAGQLTFTGCSSTAAVITDNSTGDRTVIRTTSNGGLANMVWTSCEFNDFSHMTRIEEQSPDFGTRQMPIRAALEVSGHPTRGGAMHDCNIFGTSPVAIHFGNARDWEQYSVYAEPKSYKKAVGGSSQLAGAVFIMGPKAAYFDKIPTYDRGYLSCFGKTYPSYVNMMPKVNSGSGRYGAATDMFNPLAYFSNEKNLSYVEGRLILSGNNGEDLQLRTRTIDGFVRYLAKLDATGQITIGNNFVTTGTSFIDRVVTNIADGVKKITTNSTAAADTKTWCWDATSSNGHLYLKTYTDAGVEANTVVTILRSGATVSAYQIDAGVCRLYSSVGETDIRGATGFGVRLRSGSSTTLLSSLTETVSYSSTTILRPNADNTIPLCLASNRASTVYLGSAPIVSSDRNLKTEERPLSEKEKAVAKRLNFCMYKFKADVAAKGDKARLHCGIIAQDVIAAFEAEELDAFAYGICCYNSWYSRDGELKELYQIRYEELYAFCIAVLLEAL